MKTAIILGALVLSSSAFAQRPVVKAEKEIGKAQTEVKEQAGSTEKEIKEKGPQADKTSPRKVTPTDDNKGKGDGAKDKSNNGNGNAYGKDKQGMTGKEFGQHRAAEAKAKAKTVKSGSEADEMIETSKKETKGTMDAVQTKMEEARKILTDKLSKKEITQAVFDSKIKDLMEFEKRKNSIIIEMK